jgi:excisionase family DNA binding protein
MPVAPYGISIPTEADARISEQSSRILASHINSHGSSQKIKIVENDGSEQDVTLPAPAFHLLVDILSQMAKGNAVTLIPVHAELTTQEAADILNVSRPYIVKLIESREIQCRLVGKHRRIRFSDLMEYKDRVDRLRHESLNDLVAQAQELNMGYE